MVVVPKVKSQHVESPQRHLNFLDAQVCSKQPLPTPEKLLGAAAPRKQLQEALGAPGSRMGNGSQGGPDYGREGRCTQGSSQLPCCLHLCTHAPTRNARTLVCTPMPFHCLSCTGTHTLTHTLRPRSRGVSPLAPDTAQGSVLSWAAHVSPCHRVIVAGLAGDLSRRQSRAVGSARPRAQMAGDHGQCVLLWALGRPCALLSLGPSSAGGAALVTVWKCGRDRTRCRWGVLTGRLAQALGGQHPTWSSVPAAPETVGPLPRGGGDDWADRKVAVEPWEQFWEPSGAGTRPWKETLSQGLGGWGCQELPEMGEQECSGEEPSDLRGGRRREGQEGWRGEGRGPHCPVLGHCPGAWAVLSHLLLVKRGQRDRGTDVTMRQDYNKTDAGSLPLLDRSPWGSQLPCGGSEAPQRPPRGAGC